MIVSPETLAREAAEHPVSKFAPKTKRALGPLTERQRDVVRVIQSYLRDEGYPPTLRDIGRALGLKSTNGVNQHLTALERKGYLTRSEGLSRGITLTEAGRNA